MRPAYDVQLSGKWANHLVPDEYTQTSIKDYGEQVGKQRPSLIQVLVHETEVLTPVTWPCTRDTLLMACMASHRALSKNKGRGLIIEVYDDMLDAK